MSPDNKPLLWLHSEVRSPPFSGPARVRAGFLLRRLQRGEPIGMPDSRPMPVIGRGCHELRIPDGRVQWRIVYHLDDAAVVILDVFRKKTPATPKHVVDRCKTRLAGYRANS